MLKYLNKLTWVLILAIILSLVAISGCRPAPKNQDTPREHTPIWANTDTPHKYFHPDCIDTPLLREAWKVIFDNYVEPSKINISELNRGAVAGMYEMMELNNPYPDAQPADEWQDIDLMLQAWDNIAGIIGKDKLIAACPEQGAISGMIEKLDDDYSCYFSSEIYKQVRQMQEGNYTGLGFGFHCIDKRPVINLVFESSPAARSGLTEGDIVLTINGISTEGMSFDIFDAKLRDEAQKLYLFTIQRNPSSMPVEISIEKGFVDITSVKYKKIDDIAYIKVLEFNDDTPVEFETALNKLDLKNATGMILDLRDNPGGSFSSLMEIYSYFFMAGTIFITIDNKGNRDKEKIEYYWSFGSEKDRPGTDDLISQPLIVLVNGDSASSSEALCGALRDYGRAKIAGTTTHGKGSGNMFFDLRDGSAIYLTVERFLTPYGNVIEGKGITPDFFLTQTGDDAVQWAVDYLHSSRN